jgi:hypothetical protein
MVLEHVDGWYIHALAFRRFPLAHGLRRPVTGDDKKLLSKEVVLGQSGKPHALARVA